MDRRRWAGLGLGLGLLIVAVAAAGVVLGGQHLGDRGSASYLDVDRADGDAPANRTVPYGEMTPGQQRVFVAALRDEDRFVEIPPDVDRRVWIDNRFVTYRNDTYRVMVAVP